MIRRRHGIVANGIDPATLAAGGVAGGVAGLFLGTVHDGTIEGLTLAPAPDMTEAP